MNKLAVGISTMNGSCKLAMKLALDIVKLSKGLGEISVVILSQGEEVDSMDFPFDGVTLVKSKSLGLSRSRNALIKYLHGEYIWLVDDDVVINGLCLDVVMSKLHGPDNPDVLIGRIECSDTEKCEYYKNYKARRGLAGLLKTSSIELIMNKDFIVRNNITYNEILGLGAKYPCGEENYFLVECWINKARVFFYDETFIYHPCSEKGLSNLKYFSTKNHLMSRVLLTKKLPLRFSIFYAFKILIILIIKKRDIKMALFFIKALLRGKKLGDFSSAN